MNKVIVAGIFTIVAGVIAVAVEDWLSKRQPRPAPPGSMNQSKQEPPRWQEAESLVTMNLPASDKCNRQSFRFVCDENTRDKLEVWIAERAKKADDVPLWSPLDGRSSPFFGGRAEREAGGILTVQGGRGGRCITAARRPIPIRVWKCV